MLYFETDFISAETDWLVFIHGAGGSIETWQRQRPFFSDKFNLLLIDLRDHGKSIPPHPVPSQYTFELINRDIQEIVDHLSIEKAYFLTLSFGSVIVQAYALSYPEKVAGIIMAGAVLKGSGPIWLFVQCARVLNRVLPYKSMYRLFSKLLMPKKNHQTARRIYQIQAAKLNQAAYMRWLSLYREFFRLLKLFYYTPPAVPVVLAMGEQDYVFKKAAVNYSQNFRNTELILFEKAGHICSIDAYQSFNSSCLEKLVYWQSYNNSPEK